MRRFLVLIVIAINFIFAAPIQAKTIEFDSQGTWIIDGQRWFMYGTHQVPRPAGQSMLKAEYWEKMVNNYHINSIIPGVSSQSDDLAAEYNVYLVNAAPSLKYATDNPFTPEPNDGWDNAAAKAAVREQIARPRRIMFYAAEEIPIGSFFVGYDYLTSAFPKIPVHANFTVIGTRYSPALKDYLNRIKANVISSHQGDHAANAMVMARLRDELPALKSTYILIRNDEVNTMEQDIFKAIVKGINGIRFWDIADAIGTDHYAGQFGEIIARVGGYLQEIMPGLVAPNREYQADYMKSKGADNRYYIVATPAGNNLTVSGLPKNTEFEKLFYNSGTITTNSKGTLTDSADGKIKIYRQKTAAASPSTAPGFKKGDLNKDGRVDLADYQMLRNHFGTTYTIFNYNNIVENYEN